MGWRLAYPALNQMVVGIWPESRMKQVWRMHRCLAQELSFLHVCTWLSKTKDSFRMWLLDYSILMSFSSWRESSDSSSMCLGKVTPLERKLLRVWEFKGAEEELPGTVIVSYSSNVTQWLEVGEECDQKQICLLTSPKGFIFDCALVQRFVCWVIWRQHEQSVKEICVHTFSVTTHPTHVQL